MRAAETAALVAVLPEHAALIGELGMPNGPIQCQHRTHKSMILAAVNATTAQRGQMERGTVINYLELAGVCGGTRDLLLCGAGEDALIALKKQFTGYNTGSWRSTCAS